MKKIGGFVVNLILWPVLMMFNGYHDTSEGAWFVSTFLALAMVLPIAMPKLIMAAIVAVNGQNFIFSMAECIFISCATYIGVGLMANLFAKDQFGDGFL